LAFRAWKCGLIAHAFRMELFLEKRGIIVPFSSPHISVFQSLASIFIPLNKKFQLKNIKGRNHYADTSE
jgi:hypothetical protein